MEAFPKMHELTGISVRVSDDASSHLRGGRAPHTEGICSPQIHQKQNRRVEGSLRIEMNVTEQ